MLEHELRERGATKTGALKIVRLRWRWWWCLLPASAVRWIAKELVG